MNQIKPTCAFDPCERQSVSRGLCAAHSTQLSRGVELTPLVIRAAGKTCSFDGCDKASYTKGLCSGHYSQTRKGNDLTPLRPRGVERVCSFEGCSVYVRAKGLCNAHYSQSVKGAPLTSYKPRPYRTRQRIEVCTFVGCGKPHCAKGLCYGHYAQQKRGAELTLLRPNSPASACSVDGCGTNSVTHTEGSPMCDKHRTRMSRHGDAGTRLTRSVDELNESFREAVARLGGRVVGVCTSDNAPVHCVCSEGHDCHPHPYSVLTSGQGICLLCRGAIYDAIYVVTDGTTVKFGITSGDPAPRLADHRRDGLTGVLRLTIGMPPEAAPWLEAQCLTVLRESGAVPVRGREYFDLRRWGDLILGIVDRFS